MAKVTAGKATGKAATKDGAQRAKSSMRSAAKRFTSPITIRWSAARRKWQADTAIGSRYFYVEGPTPERALASLREVLTVDAGRGEWVTAPRRDGAGLGPRKIVYWSDEDNCFIGLCPDVMGGGVHGDDEVEVFKHLCQVVEEWQRMERKR